MKTYLTEYRKPDGLYGDKIEAVDWEHAQQIADVRDRGETVIGELMLEISADRITPDQAAEMMKSLADEEAEFGERP